MKRNGEALDPELLMGMDPVPDLVACSPRTAQPALNMLGPITHEPDGSDRISREVVFVVSIVVPVRSVMIIPCKKSGFIYVSAKSACDYAAMFNVILGGVGHFRQRP